MPLITFESRCPACGHRAETPHSVCPGCGAPAGPPTLAETWNREHPGDPMLATAPARVAPTKPSRAAASASVQGSGRSAGQRRWSLVGIASPVLGILLGVGIYTTGVFDSGSGSSSSRTRAVVTASPTSPTTGQSSVGAGARSPQSAATPPAKKPATSAAIGAHRVFPGQAFSIAYPDGWTVASSEAARSWGTDTTIVSPSDPHTMLRVDVTPHPATSDPTAAAQPVIDSVAQQPGYRELGLTNGTINGRPAMHWDFVVQEAGVLLRKQDDFFTAPNGAGIAILTSAPANAYPGLAARFASLRRSVSAH
jgi:hypothetical protein